MDPGHIFQIITNSTLLATRLLSGPDSSLLEFSEPRYCAVLAEDAQLTSTVITVSASHTHGQPVRYSIIGGNKDGLFTIDQHSGSITLAANLDRELQHQHELVVAAEGGGGHSVHSRVHVRVTDVNDNPPYFLDPKPRVVVVEEDDRHLPATIAKVEAEDPDDLDHHGLLYTVRGDGVDGHDPSDAFFSINSLTGELVQRRALDRDPPRGKEIWRVRIQVRDGQALWSRRAMDRHLASNSGKVDRRLASRSRPLDGHHRRRRSGGIKTEELVRGINEESLAKLKKSIRHDKQEMLEDRTIGSREESHPPRLQYRLSMNGHDRKTRINGDQTTFASAVKGDTEMSIPKHAANQDPWKHENLFTGTKTVRDEPELTKGHETRQQRRKNENMKMSEPGFRIRRQKRRESAPGGSSQLTSNGEYRRSVTTSHSRRRRWSINLNGYRTHTGQSSFDGSSQEQLITTLNQQPQSDEETSRSLDFQIRSTASERSRVETSRKADSSVANALQVQTPVFLTSSTKPVIRLRTGDRRPGSENFLLSSELTQPHLPGMKVMRKPFPGSADPGKPSGEEEEEEDQLEKGIPFGCEEDSESGRKESEAASGRLLGGGSLHGLGGSRVHVSETVLTLFVKDINDNPPVFPNATIFGHVQENGPIDLSVAVISAWDADDDAEGTNARITYSIEKNVVRERTGEAIFSVHPDTGLVRTAVCCLDRETSPEYHIQVVATDGGGLKGTGVVVVRLVDVNDNPPRLERTLWHVEMNETWGAGPPDNSTTLLRISVLDPDTANYFFYRVVEASGWGWEHFGVRTVGAEGQLYALKTLDFEDDTHRRGFKFMVQVTDRGRGGWDDPRHLDSAWVSVLLRDVNDNPPQFHRPHAHVTVREDAAPGTPLASFRAHDPDEGGRQAVEYRVEGGWGALGVDSEGEVSLVSALDREAPDGAIGVAKILAVDGGQPPLTATATLTITVTDVNDSPPVLLPPTLFHVPEGGPPTLLGALTATDHDVWALGHGPPFNFSLAPTNPAHVLAHISIKFDPHLDSGRGGAEVWTVDAVDREQLPQLLVGVLVADAGGLDATHTLTLVIDDMNDNPMKPAAKTVYLWKTQGDGGGGGGGGSEAPLGRVYVEDPDDWDLGDKTFRWRGSPHPLFSLDANTGHVFASTQVTEGRYVLQFLVDDVVWGQRDVEANVTVGVRVLPPDSLAHAVPITLTPTTPAQLTKGWTPEDGGGGLGRVVWGVSRVVGGGSVEVVSLQDQEDHPRHTRPDDASLHPPSTSRTSTPSSAHAFVGGSESHARPHAPWACVWVSVREEEEEASRGGFMDPVKLQGLLALHSQQLEAATNLKVVMASSTTPGPGGGERVGGGTREPPDDSSLPHAGGPPDPSSAASRASVTLPLQVVDTNSTALVTPRLTRTHSCHAHEPEDCTPTSCLNGGRCIISPTGNRCVCAGGSSGSRCKVLSRSFSGGGWAWVRPLPPCLPITISLRILTRRPHALLLYSGPLAPRPRPRSLPTPMLALQLWRGHPELLLEGATGPLKLQVNASLDDGEWHTIHFRLTSHMVALMVDLCGRGWDNTTLDDSHCAARSSWTHPMGMEAWAAPEPLQVGGMAHSPPSPAHHGWREAPTPRPLDGCISHLRFNGQLVDLGEPAYSRGSEGGCRPQDVACPGGCGLRGQCVGGLSHPECECEPGWAGLGCTTPTLPATFGSSSYMKLMLSFRPGPQVVTAKLRLRTRGARNGLILLHQPTQEQAPAFAVYLRGGVVCASVSAGAGGAARAACVEGRPVGDGAWHAVTAERHGHNLVVSVDDGDAWRRNESLLSLGRPQEEEEEEEEEGRPLQPPMPMEEEDEEEGSLTVGGLPEFVGVSVIRVLDDLKDTCIDDVRVCGRRMPLPPAVNGTRWGQVTTLQGLDPGCSAPDACLNTTCAAPLYCVSSWGRASCSCGPGGQLVGRTCEDVDECLWRPCLHGGSCYNLRPGFQCVCGPGHTGQHCQWADPASRGHPLAAPLITVTLTVSFFLLVMGLVMSLRLRRQRCARGQGGKRGGQECTEVETKDRAEDDGGGLSRDEHQRAFLKCLKLASQVSLAAQGKEEKTAATDGTSHTAEASVGAGASAPTVVSSVRVGVPVGGGVLVGVGVEGLDPLLPRDDLRAYAYEGDGSSAASLTSALSGLREDPAEESNIRPLVTEFLEVMDLLRNLPEANGSPPSLAKLSDLTGKTEGEEPPKDMDQTRSSDGEREGTTPSKAKSASTFCGEEEQTTSC